MAYFQPCCVGNAIQNRRVYQLTIIFRPDSVCILIFLLIIQSRRSIKTLVFCYINLIGKIFHFFKISYQRIIIDDKNTVLFKHGARRLGFVSIIFQRVPSVSYLIGYFLYTFKIVYQPAILIQPFNRYFFPFLSVATKLETYFPKFIA